MVRRPFRDIRPFGPFIELSSEEGNEDLNRQVLSDPEDIGEDVEERLINIKESGNVCSIMGLYTREVLTFNPEVNSEPLEVADDIGNSGYWLKNLLNRVDDVVNREGLEENEAITVHVTRPDRVDSILEDGFRSRYTLGLNRHSSSELRYKSAYFHGNWQDMSRSLVGVLGGENNIPIISKIDTDKSFWSDYILATGLLNKTITEGEYEKYGVVEYEDMMECALDKQDNRDLSEFPGSFFPAKVGGRDNIDEFIEAKEEL
jgi:hypothetical protein